MANNDRRLGALMAGQFKKAVSEINEYVKFAMNPDKPNEWHIMVRNMSGEDGEYLDGEYLFRMIAPYDPKDMDKSFPYTPPEFYALTHNGLYGIEKKVCISIGVYHKDQYRAALGMAGFANQLVSGLIGWKSMGNGINILTTTADQKREYAKESVEWNKSKHGAIRDEINRQYAEYSAKWILEKQPEELIKRLELTQSKND